MSDPEGLPDKYKDDVTAILSSIVQKSTTSPPEWSKEHCEALKAEIGKKEERLEQAFEALMGRELAPTRTALDNLRDEVAAQGKRLELILTNNAKLASSSEQRAHTKLLRILLAVTILILVLVFIELVV